MSLGNVSSFATSVGSNPYVSGTMNAGWRWNTEFETGDLDIVRFTFENSGFSAGQQNQIRLMLSKISAVADIDFVEAVGAGAEDAVEIVFHRTTSSAIGGFGGYSGSPNQALSNNTTVTENGDTILVGDLGRVHTYFAIDATNGGEACFDGGGNFTNAGIELMLQMIGFSVGLKHPYDYGSSDHQVVYPGVTPFDPSDLGDNALNSQAYTVMSANGLSGGDGGESIAPMAFDIAALQLLYGPNMSAGTGDDTYVMSDAGPKTWSCIWDVGGNDQIAYFGSEAVFIFLAPATLENAHFGGGSRPASHFNTGAPHGTTYLIAGDYRDVLPDVAGNTDVNIENARGGGGNDFLWGNDADNVLNGNDGGDDLRGFNGNDTLIGGNGGDVLEGGAGRDTADYTFFGQFGISITVDLTTQANNAGGAAGDTLTSVEVILATDENDIITGDGNANIFRGYDSFDRLRGQGGDDTLQGMGGVDFLEGGLGADDLFGGGGIDEASYFNASTGVTVDLLDNAANTGEAAGDSLNSIEYLHGSNLADRLRGDNVGNILVGYDENDVLIGRGGNDDLRGGFDNDQIDDGAGHDTVDGGFGNDTLHTSAGNDGLDGGDGRDTILLHKAMLVDWQANAFDADIALDGWSNWEVIQGSAGNDTIRGDDWFFGVEFRGGSGRDIVQTSQLAANDTLSGEHGNDIVVGGGGDDTLNGGLGNDLLNGGAGRDRMIGGAGLDRFDFNAVSQTGIGAARDIIQSFQAGTATSFVDRIDLSTIDASTLAAGDQGFSYIGGAAFTAGVAAQLRAIQVSGGRTVIQGNIDGDRAAEFEILIANSIDLANLTQADFVA